MSLWDKTVRPVLLSRPLSKASIYSVSLRCVQHVVDTCASKWSREVPNNGVSRLLNLVSELDKKLDQSSVPTSDDADLQHEKMLEELDELLPDVDSHLTYASGWSCAVQAVMELALLLRAQGDLVAATSDLIDLAYQAATRDAVQGVIRAGGEAVDEEELTKIEASLPVCQSEITFQIDTLQSSGSAVPDVIGIQTKNAFRQSAPPCDCG